MHKLFLTLLVLLSLTTFAGQKRAEWQIFGSSYLYFNEQTQGSKTLKTGSVFDSPTSTVTDVVVDKNGKAYLATPVGLYVFDGKELTRLTIKSPAMGSNIRALDMDASGNLWIGTDWGLVEYANGRAESFTKEMPGMEAKIVRDIEIDKQGRVWITGWANGFGVKPSGVSVYDGKGWTNYNTTNSPLPKDFVEDLTLDTKGNLWMSVGYQDAGLAKYDGQKWEIINTGNSGLPTNIVRSIASDASGNMYFGTPQGLVKYDGSNWTTMSMNQLFANSFLNFLSQLQSQPDISALACDGSGTVWIGTKESGVYRYTPSSNQQITLDNSPLTSNAVRKIYVDPSNRKWFMTGSWYENWSDRFLEEKSSNQLALTFQGVVSYKEPDYFSHPGWEVINMFTSEVPANEYTAIEVDKDNVKWITSPTYLLKLADGQKMVMLNSGTAQLGDRFSGLALGKDGDLWIATNMKGLMHCKNDVVEKVDTKSGNMVNGISVGPDGHVWFGGKGGLTEWDGTTAKVYDGKNSGMTEKVVQSTYWDNNEKLWIGMYKGLFYYDGTTWTQYDKKNGGLTGTYVRSVLQLKSGEYWAGTQKGIGQSKDGKNWTMVESVKEVPYFSVNVLKEGPDGSVWVGTDNKGLFRYLNGNWTVYTAANSGLSHDNVLDIAFDKDGSLWLTLGPDAGFGEFAGFGSMGSAPPGSSTTPDPAIEIKKKAKTFDPDGAVMHIRL